MSWQPTASIENLQQRARMLARVRGFFAEREVIEVQTPVLGHYTVTDPDVEAIAVADYGFLQTSPEYFLKRLLAAGMPSCYQLGPVFRAGESGRQHNPEFTMLEWYRLDWDHHELMQEVAALANTLLGEQPVNTVRYADLVGPMAGRDRSDLDLAFAEACEALQGRWFVMDFPPDQAALSRLYTDATGAVASARFEMVIDGIEVANGYWELLDADEHRQRFQHDLAVRSARGLKRVAPDDLFLAALDAGLPACAGVAVGIDRLLMLALGLGNIEQVLTFRA